MPICPEETTFRLHGEAGGCVAALVLTEVAACALVLSRSDAPWAVPLQPSLPIGSPA